MIQVANCFSSTLSDSRTSRERTVLELADGRNGLERGSLEEAELDVVLEAAEGEEPALPLDAVKRAVPPHGLADAWHVLHDERVDALGDGGLPRLHAGDVGLHAGVPIGLGQRRGFAGLSDLGS